MRDYQSLFKPSVLATVAGGSVLATNHVSAVEMGPWLDSLERCATKVSTFFLLQSADPIFAICRTPFPPHVSGMNSFNAPTVSRTQIVAHK